MKIAKIASEIVSVANDLDSIGRAAAANALDDVLQKITVAHAALPKFATEQVHLDQSDVAKWTPDQKKAWLDYYKKEYEKARQKFNSLSRQSIGKKPREVDALVAQSNETYSWMSLLRHNIDTLEKSLRLTSGQSAEDDYEYGGDDGSTMTEFQKANMEEYLAHQEILKEKLRFLGGRSRIDNLVQQMTETGFGESANTIDQEIRLSRGTHDLVHIQDLMGLFEELKNNPREKSMLKELASKHGSHALIAAIGSVITDGKGIAAIQDLYRDFDKFSAPYYME